MSKCRRASLDTMFCSMIPTTIGRYEIVRELGRGAMGIVYEARDPNIGRTVALKTIRMDVAGAVSEDLLRRFRNEAKAAGNLNHPNIVTVYDAGEHDGIFYMALELMEGGTLQDALAQRGRLPTPEVLDIVRQVCAGLDFAHARGIVHRDVKPANVMFAHGVVKITDFGIANIGDGMTMTGTVLGTPNYMSPEQVLGKPLDGRSDLFGMGVMLYEMVTGERPFEGQSVTTIMYKIVHEEPIPPRKLDVTIHPGLSAVVEKALAKAPEARYQSGAALSQALSDYRAMGDAVATATSAVPLRREEAQPATDPGEGTRATPAHRATPRGNRRPLVIVAVLALAAAWGIYWTVRARPKSAPPATESPAVAAQVQQTPPAPAPPQPPVAAASGQAALVEHKPAQPSGDTAKMTVNSNPPAAAIWVDGADTDKRTPAELQLKPGDHMIAVRMNGFQEAAAKFRVKGGEEFEFSPKLVPGMPTVNIPAVQMPNIDLSAIEKMKGATAEQMRQMQLLQRSGTFGVGGPSLIVTSRPGGARVLVDDKDTGMTTPAVIPEKPGTYRVRVELEGYPPAERNVTVGEHKPGIANFPLQTPARPEAPR
jgi:hypothetical protein